MLVLGMNEQADAGRRRRLRQGRVERPAVRSLTAFTVALLILVLLPATSAQAAALPLPSGDEFFYAPYSSPATLGKVTGVAAGTLSTSTVCPGGSCPNAFSQNSGAFINSGTGDLYAASGLTGKRFGLVRVPLSTGVATLVGQDDTEYIFGIAPGISGSAYGIGGAVAALWTVNLSTGSLTRVGTDLGVGAGTFNGFAKDPTTGNYYAMKRDSGNLYQINVSTGTATLVGAVPTLTGSYSLQVDSSGTFWNLSTSSVLTSFTVSGGTISSPTTQGSFAAFTTAAMAIKWATYSVTYDANGATSGTAPTDAASPYASGATVTVAGNTGSLARTGFVFSGWNTAANGSGTSYSPAATFAINGNTTLYAQWKNAVTYDANGATSGTVPTDPASPYVTGSTVTVLGNTGSLTRAGYNFDGWNTAADGAGTPYAPAATFAVNANTTLFATWTPTSGGGGGGSTSSGSSSDPASSTVPSSPLPSLGAETVVGGLAPGADRVTVGGTVVPVVVGPNAQNTGLDVSGPGWRLSLASSTSSGGSSPLGPNGVLRFVRGQGLAAEGVGFKPNSPVQLFLFSNATFLGELTTDAAGSFSGSVDLPPDVAVGDHVAQVNGYTTGNQVRSVSLGIEVVEPATASTSVGSRVYFAYRSARLTPKAKRTLTSLAAQVPADATASSVVVGVVRAQDPVRADRSLARARAARVARYLRAAGLPGSVTVRTTAVTVKNVAAARRVVVTVRYVR